MIHTYNSQQTMINLFGTKQRTEENAANEINN